MNDMFAASDRVAPGRWLRCRLAGRSVLFNQLLPPLEPFHPTEVPGKSLMPPSLALNGGETWLIEGLLAGEQRRIEIRRQPAGTWLRLENGPAIWVASDGSAVGIASTPTDIRDTLVVESLLGPGAILALAQQDVFCLHASGVTIDGHAVAFCGPSGAGKSTLASLLNALGPRWRQLVDDVLPIEMDEGRPWVRPRFPQLKMSAVEQASLLSGLPERLPLAAVYLLRHFAHTESRPETPVRRVVLGPRQAVVGLVEATLAARLFSGSLAARHLAFCSRLVDRVPVRQLWYPHERDVAQAIASAISQDLSIGP